MFHNTVISFQVQIKNHNTFKLALRQLNTACDLEMLYSICVNAKCNVFVVFWAILNQAPSKNYSTLLKPEIDFLLHGKDYFFKCQHSLLLWPSTDTTTADWLDKIIFSET